MDDGLWARRLVELDRARIDTIHGLCADILRANAAVAGIDPKFEVLDEVEAAIMLGEVVDDMRSSMTTPISKLFAQYDDFRIVEVLNQLDLVNRDLPPLANSPVQLLGRWEREWSNNVMVARERLAQSYESTALDELLVIPADDKLGALVLQYRAYLWQIKDEQDAAAVLQLLADCHRKGAVGRKGSARAWGDNANRDHAAQLLRDLRDQLKDVLKEIGDPPGEIDQAAADVLPLWHQLLQKVATTYRNRKRARARVDFDDLERLTAELLRDKSVRDRYRNAEFKHLLVDEFQDTNAAQWQIVQALGDLSRGGSLFVVGDPKQSIYQFRGADVSVFNLVRDKIAVGASGRALPLSMSFRSHQKLVRQLNTLFERILYRDKASPVADYQVDFGLPMSAFRKDSPSYPAIELQLLDKGVRDKSGEYVTEKNGRKRQYGADDMRRWEAWELAELSSRK